MRKLTTALAATALVFTAPLLTGCSTEDQAADTSQQTAETATSQPVTIVDGWAKAGEKGGMTGVFGTIENHGDKDLVITGLTSDVAGMIQLHEVVDGKMQEIKGDVTIPAGGSLKLAPGENHIMLMELASDLLAGDEVAFQLAFDDGSTADFSVLVKDYSAAQEDYVEGHSDSGDMEMEDDEAAN